MKELYKLIRQIESDSSKGIINPYLDIQLVNMWDYYFGAGGCDCYPYATRKHMIEDLKSLLLSNKGKQTNGPVHCNRP